MIAQPALLHPADYLDPARHAAEQAAIFARHWQFVGFADELAEPGSYLTRQIAGEPVLVINMDGELRAFRNVCAHRFARLKAAESGRESGLRCPYHGWAYDREGVPLGIPGNQDCFGLDRADKQGLALKRFTLDQIGRFIFVRIAADGPALTNAAAPHGDLLQRLSDGFGPPFAQVAQPWDADWKIGIENVLEVYHVDAVHPESFRTVVDGSWRVESQGAHSIGYAGMRPEALRWWEGVGKRLGLAAVAGFDHYVHLHLFPNLAIGITAGRMISVQTFEPTGPGRFTLRYRLCLALGGKVGAARAAVESHLTALNETLLGEDRAIASEVQIGTAHADRPALLGRNEERLMHFHQTLLPMLR
jgi:phenylpropionate dioxygenase-like ring-hydroxylating dioxygenase large terminal subunit